MYNNEEYISEQDKQKMIDDYKKNAEKRLFQGKMIVYTLAILTFLVTLLSNILYSFNLFNIIVRFAMSVALIRGIQWVRWLFVATACLSVFLLVVILPEASGQTISLLNLAIIIVGVVSDILCITFLSFNKSVSEFLYDQSSK
ncbi:MAG: hypothetical protein E7401_02515 [Ruminococcaceae bacterium]|nr:hypothetical protein [Oscillospiraceae bacterium]